MSFLKERVMVCRIHTWTLRIHPLCILHPSRIASPNSLKTLEAKSEIRIRRAHPVSIPHPGFDKGDAARLGRSDTNISRIDKGEAAHAPQPVASGAEGFGPNEWPDGGLERSDMDTR